MPALAAPRTLLFGAACALGLSASGCARDNDVVAVRPAVRLEGGFLSSPKVLPCQEGKYGGFFNTPFTSGAAPPLVLDGTISFSLVKVTSGELDFKIAPGAKLVGKSAADVPFSADIDSDNSGCHEGYFHVNLIHGGYKYSDASPPFPFVGKVSGYYLAYASQNGVDDFEGFLGNWQAFAGTSSDGGALVGAGRWSALWQGPN